MLGGLITSIAKDMFSSALDDQIENLRISAKDAVSDTIHRMIAGKQGLGEWAETASRGIDRIVEKIVTEENLQYLGGKLRFYLSENNKKKVKISFDLYFYDDSGQYQKMSAESDIFVSTFTDDAVEELMKNRIVEYNLEV